MTIETLTQVIYLVSTGAFILSLKWMSDPKTAMRGVFAGVGAMLLAVAGTLLHPEIVAFHWTPSPSPSARSSACRCRGCR